MYDNRFREIRVKRGYKQKEVAALLNTSRETYSKYENGKIDPRATAIVKLCEFYDLSADYLLGLSPVQHTLSYRKKTIIKAEGYKGS